MIRGRRFAYRLAVSSFAALLGANARMLVAESAPARATRTHYGSTVCALEIDPADHMTIYAGTGAGLFRSSDGGTTWLEVDQQVRVSVGALAREPGAATALYAGTGSGLLRAAPGEDGRPALHRGLEGIFVGALAVDPSSVTVYAGSGTGVHKSSDRGKTWRAARTGSPISS
jgi:photosystem II stability/assembly factor-like uncharacterized protein